MVSSRSRGRDRQRRRSRRRWNYRLLAATAVFCVVVGGLAHLHVERQRQRLAQELLAEAQLAETRADWRGALEAWEKFLALRPGEPAGLTGRALAFANVAETRQQKLRALKLAGEVLDHSPQRVKLLAVRARLALEVGDLPLAVAQAERALRIDPDQSQVLRSWVGALTGMALSGDSVSWNTVAEALAQAVARLPGDEVLALQLAWLYRERPETAKGPAPAAADAVLDRLVLAAPRSAAAFLARWEYRRAFRLPGGDDDLRRAVELGPDQVGVRLAAGQAALERRDWNEAALHFDRLIALEPDNRRGYLGRAEAESGAGQDEKCRATLRAGLEAADPRDVLLNLRLAERLLSVDLDAAGEHLERASASLWLGNEPDREVRLARRARALAVVEGRFHLARRQWAAALDSFAAVFAEPTAAGDRGPTSAERITAYYGQASCFGQLGQEDRAAAAYDAARQIEPQSAAHCLAAGRAWLAAGQPGLALAAWKQAQSLTPAESEAARSLRRAVARAEVASQRLQPPARRSWAAADAALNAMAGDTQSRMELALLTAERRSLSGEQAAAVAVLRQAREQFPASLEVWRRLVLALVEAQRPDEADQLLREPGTTSWPRIEVLRTTVERYLAERQFSAALVPVRAELEQANDADRTKLLQILSEIHLAAGDLAAARRSLIERALFEPGQPTLTTQLADLALQGGDWPDLQVWEDRLRELEGRDGAGWRYFQARRLLAQVQRADDPRLAHAAELADELAVRRPHWSRTWLLRGLLSEAQGGTPEASLAAYRQALQAPDADLLALERLVALLDGQSRLAEAEPYVDLWADRLTTSRWLSARVIESLLALGQGGRAVRLARLAVDQRPGDPLRRLWLAQTLAAIGDNRAAEAQFITVIEGSPGDGRAWTGLFLCQLAAERQAAARETLIRLAATSAVDPAAKFRILCEGFARLGDAQLADEAYREALRLAPADPGLHERAAAFFLGRDDAFAEQLLRRLIELAPNPLSARQQLIRTLASRGDERAWQEAWRLLQAGRPSSRPPQADDLRLEAWVLSRRGTTAERKQAVERLSQLRYEFQQASDEDLRLLGQLYRELEQPTHARRLLTQLADREEASSGDLVAAAEVLLGLGADAEAGPYIRRLAEREPTAWTTLLLRGRLLRLQGQVEAIQSTFEPIWQSQLDSVDDPAGRGLVHWQAGRLYAALEQDDAAERHFRQALSLAPQGSHTWTGWLTARGRFGEAVDHCCQRLSDRGTPEEAIALCDTLTVAGASAELIHRARPLLEVAGERFADHTGFLLARGNLAFTAGESQTAIDYFRRVLEREPDHVAALNNLAMLLSEDPPSLSEAEQRLTAALKLAGPRPWLQETLAVIRLRQGNLAEARDLLTALALEPRPSPTSWFHLAVLQQQAGQPDEARRALAEAERAQLDARHLSSSERLQLAELTKVLHDDPGEEAP